MGQLSTQQVIMTTLCVCCFLFLCSFVAIQDFHVPAAEIMRASCPEILVAHFSEIEAMYRLRLNKKMVYVQLLTRLEKTCELV